ncbi:MAG: type II secretion system F family protein [Bacillota bacterium]|nr:type II secretion system F family protein [Bacillota bacterium]
MTYKGIDYKKIVFLRQLSLLYDSDVYTIDGIELLQKGEKDERMKAFYERFIEHMNLGNSLSQSMEQSCDFFEPYELKLIELGEQSGNISTILSDMANGIEREKMIDEKIELSFRYPKILTALTLSILLLIIAIIVPIYHDLVHSAGAEIGFLMASLNSFGLYLRDKITWVLLVMAALILGYQILKRSAGGRAFLSKWSIKSLLTKKIRLRVATIIFTKNLALLLDCGIDFLSAFHILERAESHETVKQEIQRALAVLKETDSFKESMQSFTIFPELLQEILTLSISTGHIVPSLKKIEHSMHIELNKDIDRLISMIEPMVTIVISILVGLVLFSGVIPVFRILSDLA